MLLQPGWPELTIEKAENTAVLLGTMITSFSESVISHRLPFTDYLLPAHDHDRNHDRVHVRRQVWERDRNRRD